MKFLSFEKRSPVPILFVSISLATVTSSKLNVKNSAKARYVDETHSYRLLKFEINKSDQRILRKRFKITGSYVKQCQVYNKKAFALVWEYIVLNSFYWRSCPRKLGRRLKWVETFR